MRTGEVQVWRTRRVEGSRGEKRCGEAGQGEAGRDGGVLGVRWEG